MSDSRTIYCISGLGADEKIFDNLQLNGCVLKHIPWLRPGRREKIEAYASRMAAFMNDETPTIIGVSFGGMMAIEIAKLRKIQQVILVSSIKSRRELPAWMRVAGNMRLNRWVPIRSYKITERIDNRRLGVSTPFEKEMVRAYRKKADPVYLQWAVNQVLNWKNDWLPDNTIHIHGDADRIFPIGNIKAHHVIRDGTHMIIYNRAKEIAACIEQALSMQVEVKL